MVYAFLFLIGSLLLATGAQADATHDLKFDGKVITGTKSSRGKTVKFTFPAEEENGLILIPARFLASKVNDKARAEAHPFSFANPEMTTVNAKLPDTYFLFSSFKSQDQKLEAKNVSQFVIGFARKDAWNKHQFSYLNADFELVTPKKNPHIDTQIWENGTRKVWKAFTDKFGPPTDHVVIVDLEGPISGGPLGENVLEIFATDSMNKDMQIDMEANLGWKPHTSTKAYVESYYPKSKNQWEEYLLGTFAHEIGHLFFGFGVTRQEVKEADELWFSLGLGMLNDMEITKAITGNYPQLEVDIIESWKSRYSKYKDIDQRLANPDRAADKKYQFDRKKVFAHGKATYYLKALREKIGASRFDAAVREYLKSCAECKNGYPAFKRLFDLKDQKHAEELEREMSIF